MRSRACSAWTRTSSTPRGTASRLEGLTADRAGCPSERRPARAAGVGVPRSRRSALPRRNDRNGSAGLATQPAPLTLGEAAPDPEPLVVLKRVLEALGLYLTAGADALGLPGRPALFGKEGLRVGLGAQRLLLPIPRLTDQIPEQQAVVGVHADKSLDVAVAHGVLLQRCVAVGRSSRRRLASRWCPNRKTALDPLLGRIAHTVTRLGE